MAKPVDKNDSTMEVSTSQLVPDLPKPRPPEQKIPQNDRSVWKQVVVGTDDFAPAAVIDKPGSRRWIVVAVLGALVAAAGGYVLYRVISDDGQPAVAPDPAKPAVLADAAMAVVPDAAPVLAPPDAAPVTPPDAATAATEPPIDAGAPIATPIAKPVAKPVVKRPVVKRPVVKKPVKKPAAKKPIKKPVPKKRP